MKRKIQNHFRRHEFYIRLPVYWKYSGQFDIKTKRSSYFNIVQVWFYPSGKKDISDQIKKKPETFWLYLYHRWLQPLIFNKKIYLNNYEFSVARWKVNWLKLCIDSCVCVWWFLQLLCKFVRIKPFFNVYQVNVIR